MNDDQRTGRQLRTLRRAHQNVPDLATVSEAVGDFTLAFDLMTGNDLPGLGVLFAGTELRVVFGRQRPIMFGALVLQLLCIHAIRARRRLRAPQQRLLANNLRSLVLLDQAGFEQLFLQRVAHEEDSGGCAVSGESL